MGRVLVIDYMLPENTYTYELCRELSKHCEVKLLTKK